MKNSSENERFIYVQSNENLFLLRKERPWGPAGHILERQCMRYGQKKVIL